MDSRASHHRTTYTTAAWSAKLREILAVWRGNRLSTPTSSFADPLETSSRSLLSWDHSTRESRIASSELF